MGPVEARVFGALLILCALPALRLVWRAINSGRLPNDLFWLDEQAESVEMLDDPFGFWFPTLLAGLGGPLAVAFGISLILMGDNS